MHETESKKYNPFEFDTTKCLQPEGKTNCSEFRYQSVVYAE
jgi:hypothetical protein